jgi:hypothetical protein
MNGRRGRAGSYPPARAQRSCYTARRQMRVDRYISELGPETYVLVAYGANFPVVGAPAGSGWTAVGASDTRTYPEAVCNEIEEAIQTKGFWLGHLDFRPSDPGRALTTVR